MRRSLETGTVTASEIVPLGNKNDAPPELSLISAGPSGMIAVLINIERLLSQSVTGGEHRTADPLRVSLFSGARPLASHRLYGAHGSAGEAPSQWSWLFQQHNVSRTYDWAGKLWHVAVSDTPRPLPDRHASALWSLLAGLFASVAAAWVAQSQHAKTERVMNLVGRRTAELRSLNAILTADIEARKTLVEELGRSHQQLRELAEHNARVKEDERKRIAREIHDDLGQSMLALRIDLSLMASGEPGQVTPERIHSALLQIDNTMDSMRMIINELRPTVLDLGLDAAVEWEVAKFQRRTGIECRLDIRGDQLSLSDDISTALYRIVQESMTNIMRHAKASRVDIHLWSESGWLFLTLADNGVGMTEQCRRKAKSFGLIGIAERIYALGGAFDTESTSGKGTVLTIAVPYAPLADLATR